MTSVSKGDSSPCCPDSETARGRGWLCGVVIGGAVNMGDFRDLVCVVLLPHRCPGGRVAQHLVEA